jgi:hypothetical protein
MTYNPNCPNIARGHWRDRMTPEQYVDLMNAASMPQNRIPNRFREERLRNA